MASPTVTLVIATLEAARSEFSPIPEVIVSSPVDVERHHNAIGTNLDGSFLNAHSCANNASGLCPNHAVKKCQACLLVQYCSKGCQLNDWNRHKGDCRLARFVKHDVCPEVERPPPEQFLLSTKESWSRLAWPSPSALTESLESELDSLHTLYSPESRHMPDITAGKKYLWGTTPPLDILNLAPNEGSNYDKPLVLNFRGADDLRHVMKTIVSLPENYTSPITSLIYETDMDLQIRNIIILMLALHYPDGQAAEFITHLWYSASIPCKMYLVLMDKILPCLKDIVKSLDGRSDIKSAKKVVVGTSSLEMVLTKGQFKELYDRLYPIGLETLANAETKRWSTMHTIQPIINVKIRQWLHNLPPWHRMTEENYRHTGILLPHGTPVHPFRTPNPTFYDLASEVLLHLFASPLDNHDLPRLRETCNRLGLPPNDLHGAAFFETKELVAAFCSRLTKMTVEFLITTHEIGCGREMGGNDLSDHSTSTTGSESASEATTANAEDVTLRCGAAQKFLYDRILVSKLTGKLDEYDTKDKPSNLALILKPQGENPHAAVLALLTSATESGHIRSSDLLNHSRYITRLLPHKWHVYSGKAYQKALEQKLGSVNEWRKSELALMEAQDREFFAIYLEYKQVLASANDVGLMMVSEDDMTITPAWPYRLEMAGSEKEQEKQFELRFTSKMKGCERLVMFKAIPGWKPRKHRDRVDWDCIFAEAERREENTKEDRENQLRLGKYEKYALAVCWK